MKTETLQAAREALQIGIENTDELLTRHDCDYGRTTRKNRIEAERLESDIEKMRAAVSSLKKPDGSFHEWPELTANEQSTTYPLSA